MKELNFTKVYSPVRFEDPNVYNLTGEAEIVDFGEDLSHTTIIYNPYSKSFEIYINEPQDFSEGIFCHIIRLCPDEGSMMIEDALKNIEEKFNIKINIEL